MKRAVQTDSAHEGVGARISRYFIQNPSITLLCFALLLVGGVASFLLLRTSGFPSANISLVAVTTVYPGASAGTVEQRVSIPLETAVKSIDGVDTVTAQSRDSVSTLVINLESDADVPQSEARIRSAVDGATLPSEVEPPTVTTPDITADQFVYVLSPVGDATSDDTYEAVRQLRQRLLVDPGVENVTIPGDFIRTVKVTFDPGKLADEGLDVDSAVAQVSGFGLQ
ncbi:MAG TPA: efflux RND transporter permease subunit, partial [Candidatus Saccharimonadales bacterium]